MTNKQERFCEEYIKDLNATQAAIRAGYSDKRASEQAYQLLQKTTVQKKIKSLQSEVSNRNKIEVDDIVKYLVDTLMVDPTEIYNEDGSLKPLSEMSKAARMSIKSIKKKTTRKGDVSQEEMTIELFSKEGAADKLMKHLGGYAKDNDQKNPGEAIRALINFTRGGKGNKSK